VVTIDQGDKIEGNLGIVITEKGSLVGQVIHCGIDAFTGFPWLIFAVFFGVPCELGSCFDVSVVDCKHVSEPISVLHYQ